MSKRILLADDDPTTRRTLASFLRDEGFVPTLASNGSEAFREFMAADFDVVVTDLDMPNMRGEAFVRRLRELGHDVPILVISCDCGEEAQREVRAAGANAFVRKPIDLTLLLDQLNAITRGPAGMWGLDVEAP